MKIKVLKKLYIYWIMLIIGHYTWASVPNSVIDIIDNPVATFGSPRGIGCTPDGTTAYIANYFGGNVSVVDIASNSVIKTIYSDTFNGPNGVGVTSDGTKVYILNDGGDSVSIINTTSNEVTGTIDTTHGGFNHPFGIAIFGTTAYVANYSGNSVSIIDTTTDAVTGYVSNGNFNSPHEIAVFQDKAYVTNYGGTTVSIIDTTTHTVTGIVADIDSTINQPFGIAFNPAGTYAFVTNYANNTVSIIRSSDNTVIGIVATEGPAFNNPQTINISGDTAYVGNYSGDSIAVINISTPYYAYVSDLVGNSSLLVTPYTGFITPNGSFLYMANIGSNNVSILNTSTNSIIGQILNTGFNQPLAMAINQQGTTGYVVNYVGFINIIDIATNTVTGVVLDEQSTLNQPTAIITIPQTTKAYVTNYGNNSVSIINTNTNTVIGTVIDTDATFNNPIAIAVTADGKTAYTVNYTGNSVSIIDTATDTTLGTVCTCAQQLYSPISIAITPNGKTGLVGNYSEGSFVAVINTDPTSQFYNKILGSINGNFNNPSSIAITLDSSTAYVTNQNDNTVSIIDIANNTVIETIQDSSIAPTLNGPKAIALAYNSNIGYVANYNNYTITIFDTATNKVTGTIADSSLYGPNFILITKNGQNGYITNTYSNAVSIIFVNSVIQAPITFKIEYVVNNFIDYIARMNILTWVPSQTGIQAAKYNIYKSTNINQPIATIQANKPLQYIDYNIEPNQTYTYYIVAIDSNNNASLPISKTITTQGK